MILTNVLLACAQAEDQDSVRAAPEAIRGQPYRLEVVNSLADCLAAVREGRVDAILLDLNLPDSLGITTFLRLQPKARASRSWRWSPNRTRNSATRWSTAARSTLS